MELAELIGDMAMRFINVEKTHYPKIRYLRSQIEAMNNNYEVIKEKPHIFLQNILLFFLSDGVLFFFLWIFFRIIPSAQESFSVWISEEKSRVKILVGFIFIIPIILIVLNIIRGKIKQKRRIRKANEWWEQIGKAKVVEFNNSIDAIRAEAYEYLSANQLYEWFSARSWDNSKDCSRVYEMTVRYNLSSIQQAFAFYEEVLNKEHEREEDRHRYEEILEAIEENNRYQKELAAQGSRAEFDRSIIELQLFEMKNRH